MSLTPREKELVKSTWELVKKDYRNFGIELFMIIFKYKPEYKNFFPFKAVPMEKLRENKKFQAHTINVMYTLGAIIDNLDSDILPYLLEKNTAIHAARKIPAEAFELLSVAVPELFQILCPGEYTEEAANAWKHVLDVAFKDLKIVLSSAEIK